MGLVGKQTLTKRQQESAATIGQETKGTDADKATGQDMKQEAAQELLSGKGQHSLVIALRVVLPAEGDLVILEGDEAMVGDGDAMSIAAEIAQHMLGTAERWFGVDDPVLPEQGTQESAESWFVL